MKKKPKSALKLSESRDDVYHQRFAVSFDYPVHFTNKVFKLDNPLLLDVLNVLLGRSDVDTEHARFRRDPEVLALVLLIQRGLAKNTARATFFFTDKIFESPGSE